MSAPSPGSSSQGKRSLWNLRNLPRSSALSKYRAALERAGKRPSRFPPLSYFSPTAWWLWLRTYAREAFARSCPFRTDAGPRQSIYRLRNEYGAEKVRVAMAGDWGTGTAEAEFVTESMVPAADPPHYTIHLGDVYYVGDAPAIGENCLGKRNPSGGPFSPVRWRLGRLGSFAMNGNHEMYATGEPYFSDFLPKLGLLENGKPTGQRVSYFCLENDHWRMIGLDTGYHSRGIPFLQMFGAIIPLLRPSCKLPDAVIAWLREIVRIQEDHSRGLILLTHHQYYSAFEESYPKTAEQLSELIDRPVLWFWGHEHRMAGYRLQGSKKIQAHGRCIGHGGMPVERAKARSLPKPASVAFFDNRLYANPGNFGWNGYVTLDFDGPHLKVQYLDIEGIRRGANRVLIEENWSVDNQGGLTVEIGQRCMQADFYGPQEWG